MKRMLAIMLVIAFAAFAMPAPASGQNGADLWKNNVRAQSRPDPTGLGRYHILSGQTFEPRAEILDSLPPGSELLPSQLGEQFFNSTSPTWVELVRLTEKASVWQLPNGDYALAGCGPKRNKFNKLFRPTPTANPGAQQQQQQKIVLELGQALRGEKGDSGPQGIQGEQGPPGRGCTVTKIEGKAFLVCPDGTNTRVYTGMGTGTKVLIGGGIVAAGGLGLWALLRKHGPKIVSGFVGVHTH